MSQPETKSFESPAASNYPPTPRDEWRWGWNALIGFHYGPIFVGLLIAIPIDRDRAVAQPGPSWRARSILVLTST